MELLETEKVKKEQIKANRSFMSLGFGTVAYFDIHFQLAILFFIMLLLAIPSMYFFAYFKLGNRNKDGIMHAITLGNIGFSSIVCKDTALAVNHLHLK